MTRTEIAFSAYLGDGPNRGAYRASVTAVGFGGMSIELGLPRTGDLVHVDGRKALVRRLVWHPRAVLVELEFTGLPTWLADDPHWTPYTREDVTP